MIANLDAAGALDVLDPRRQAFFQAVGAFRDAATATNYVRLQQAMLVYQSAWVEAHEHRDSLRQCERVGLPVLTENDFWM